jgi:mannose-6-phosphate isomerase-like protein (cupin superfamily)
MAMQTTPYLIDLPKIGETAIGYLSIIDFQSFLPFKPERIYWTYYTPESIVRGRHAHYTTEQVLIAVSGSILVNIEMKEKLFTFKLDKPDQGLYIPPLSWHTMQYSHSAVQVILASTSYNESDYIRDYSLYKSLIKGA